MGNQDINPGGGATTADIPKLDDVDAAQTWIGKVASEKTAGKPPDPAGPPIEATLSEALTRAATNTGGTGSGSDDSGN